jgi:hypothetical protein
MIRETSRFAPSLSSSSRLGDGMRPKECIPSWHQLLVPLARQSTEMLLRDVPAAACLRPEHGRGRWWAVNLSPPLGLLRAYCTIYGCFAQGARSGARHFLQCRAPSTRTTATRGRVPRARDCNAVPSSDVGSRRCARPGARHFRHGPPPPVDGCRERETAARSPTRRRARRRQRPLVPQPTAACRRVVRARDCNAVPSSAYAAPPPAQDQVPGTEESAGHRIMDRTGVRGYNDGLAMDDLE